MSANRGRQARYLAKALTERARTKVTLDYREKTANTPRAWHVQWTDGPTWQQMLSLAASLAAEAPGLDIAHLRPSRGRAALAEAVAVLLWLDKDPANAEAFPACWLEFAFDTVAFPDRAPSEWRRRGQALLSLTDGRIGAAVCAELDARIQADGWEATVAWLDEMASGERRLKAIS